MKYQKVSVIFAVLLATAVSFVFFEESACGENSDKHYDVGIRFVATTGMSSSQYYEFADTLFTVINDRYGYKLRLKKFNDFPSLELAFKRQEIDMAFMWASHVAEAAHSGTKVYPWATIAVGGKRKTSYCMWSKKIEGKKIENTDFVGKSVFIYDNTVFNFIRLKSFLVSKGIDTPLWKLFDSFIPVASPGSGFMALGMGDADFFWTDYDNVKYLKAFMSEVYGQIMPNTCTDYVYARNNFAFNGASISEEKAEELRIALGETLDDWAALSKEYSGFRAIRAYMGMVKMKVIPASRAEFDYELEMYEEAVKKGWIKELELIVKGLHEAELGSPVKIRPDFKTCKEMCAHEEGQMGCFEKCME